MTIANITAKLTIGNETREVEGFVVEWGNATTVTLHASVTTTQGKQSHIGSLRFPRNPEDSYNVKNCNSITYHGMRGNGHAKRSKFRHIGFL
jgi:hypothetical protein